MEYNPAKGELITGRELSKLDIFVLDFLSILIKNKVDYVIVSGYVSIVLGRSRATEDVDLLVPEMSFSDFNSLFSQLSQKDYECANTTKPEEAYNFMKEHAIRFYKKGNPIPNIEFKLIKNDLDRYSFGNRIRLIIGKKQMFISPLELHVAFKLLLAADGTEEELASDKDIEDARFIYQLFKDKLNKEVLTTFIDKLKVRNKLRWIE